MHTIPLDPHSQRLGRISVPDQPQPLEIKYARVYYSITVLYSFNRYVNIVLLCCNLLSLSRISIAA